MATHHVLMIEVAVNLTDAELGKTPTLTGVTGNPIGTVVGVQHYADPPLGAKAATMTITAVPVSLTFQ